MVVCKFFLRGNCRNGESCAFTHVSPEELYGSDDGSEYTGTSVLKRDNTKTYEPSSEFYDRSKNNIYRKCNDRNVQGQYVTATTEYYGNPPMQQYDTRQQQYRSPQRFPNDRYHYDSRPSRQQNQQQHQQPHQQQHQQQQPSQQNFAQKPPEITIDEMYVLTKSEIGFVENSKIWPLTSVCVVKLFGSLEDWYDYSPEEMRLAAYLAKASNNFEGYKATLDKVALQAQVTRDFYKSTTKETSTKLRAYIKQLPTTIYPLDDNELDFSRINYSLINLSSSHTNEFGTIQPLTTLSELQQQPTEDTEMAHSSLDKVEDSLKNVSQDATSAVNFGLVQGPNTFFAGFAPQETKQSSNVFGFSQNNQSSSDVFSSSNQQSTNSAFGFPQSSQQSVNIFGTSTVQSQDDSQTVRDLKEIFPNLAQTDFDIEILSLLWRGDSPYSLKGEITEEEYEQFKAPKFTVGKIPLIPPPRELC